ncbi:MAG: hypothetical protein RIR26_692 [Pseudomonadota bacterium]|jgi:soluble lytic murein transglycosylase-like protein
MKRPKGKWRSQNIAIASLALAALGSAWADVPPSSPAPEPFTKESGPLGGRPASDSQLKMTLLEERVEPASSSVNKSPLDGPAFSAVPAEGVGLNARTLRGTTSGPDAIPELRGSFKDFALPSSDRWWELHGLKQSPELKRAVRRLSEHLVGTTREKSSAYRYCESRRATLNRGPQGVVTPDGIGCLYYTWQKLLRESKKNESVPQKVSASGKKQKKGKATASRRKSQPSGTLSLASRNDLSSLQEISYVAALKRIEFRSEAAALRGAQTARENPTDCKLTSLRAAVLRDLENFLPSAAVWNSMNQLYQIVAPCLHPAHEAFEVVNLRMALLQLERKDLNKAAAFFDVALQSKSPEDEYIALFWRGYLDHLQKPLPGLQPVSSATAAPAESTAGMASLTTGNVFWDRLLEKYPLTLHALVVDAIRGLDSYERYEKRTAPSVSVYSGQEWGLGNVSHLMAAIFLVNGSKRETERLARLLDESNVSLPSLESAMFRLKFMEASGNQRAIIRVVWASLKQFGTGILSPDLLDLLYPVKFRNEITQQASQIDPALVFSLIRQESNFNPRATSPVGARGLMQVMPNTARRIERKKRLDLYDPHTNIRIGAKYLGILRRQHNGDYARLIASYNAGPNNTKKWDARYNGEVPLLFADLIPFPETRNYVTGLMRHMYWYRALVSHIKEAHPTTRIQWSWSLNDVIPKREQFGIKPDAVFEAKIEALPWSQQAAEPPAKNAVESR